MVPVQACLEGARCVVSLAEHCCRLMLRLDDHLFFIGTAAWCWVLEMKPLLEERGGGGELVTWLVGLLLWMCSVDFTYLFAWQGIRGMCIER